MAPGKMLGRHKSPWEYFVPEPPQPLGDPDYATIYLSFGKNKLRKIHQND